MDRKTLGKVGEELVYKYLKRSGYTVEEKNYKTRVGEVDIFASKSGKLYAIEVKTSQVDDNTFDKNEEGLSMLNVDQKKMRKIYLITTEYIKTKNEFEEYGIYVASVKINQKEDKARINLIKEIN